MEHSLAKILPKCAWKNLNKLNLDCYLKADGYIDMISVSEWLNLS